MATINMLVIKHMKQESVRSVIDVVIDKEINNLNGIVPEELEKLFRPLPHHKNTFRLETEPGDLLVLELMKSMRRKQWQLMTSHSFVHLSIEKIMESHFYFERIINPVPVLPPVPAVVLSQQPTTPIKPVEEKTSTPQLPSAPIESINKLKSDPEVAALILDRTKQQGPYVFSDRQSLATGNLT